MQFNVLRLLSEDFSTVKKSSKKNLVQKIK